MSRDERGWARIRSGPLLPRRKGGKVLISPPPLFFFLKGGGGEEKTDPTVSFRPVSGLESAPASSLQAAQLQPACMYVYL